MAALVEEVPGIAATEEDAGVEAGAALEEVPRAEAAAAQWAMVSSRPRRRRQGLRRSSAAQEASLSKQRLNSRRSSRWRRCMTFTAAKRSSTVLAVTCLSRTTMARASIVDEAGKRVGGRSRE